MCVCGCARTISPREPANASTASRTRTSSQSCPSVRPPGLTCWIQNSRSRVTPSKLWSPSMKTTSAGRSQLGGGEASAIAVRRSAHARVCSANRPGSAGHARLRARPACVRREVVDDRVKRVHAVDRHRRSAVVGPVDRGAAGEAPDLHDDAPGGDARGDARDCFKRGPRHPAWHAVVNPGAAPDEQATQVLITLAGAIARSYAATAARQSTIASTSRSPRSFAIGSESARSAMSSVHRRVPATGTDAKAGIR